MNTPQSLLSLLGVSWESGVPVVAVAWGDEGVSVGFAQGDGHLAVADTHWPDGPRAEARAGGGVAIVPASKPAPRPLRAACHQGACLSLAADTGGAFLTGGDDGRVVQVPRVGNPAVLAHLPGAWIDALACGRGGQRAFACGRQVHRLSADSASSGDAIELPAPATALAWSPRADCLAAAHSGGVTLWPASGLPRRLAWHGYHRALAWSPDGRFIVTGMQENALHGWRVADGGDIEMGGYAFQPLSLSFSSDGRYLATSGGTRPVCWGFDPPGGPAPVRPKAGQPARGAANEVSVGAAHAGPHECGIASKTPVNCVSAHPRQSLIAAGYHNGAIVLCQPGSDEGLFVKGAGGGAVNALAWSGDGGRLAFGTQDGVFGWVGLADALFRPQGAASRSKELVP